MIGNAIDADRIPLRRAFILARDYGILPYTYGLFRDTTGLSPTAANSHDNAKESVKSEEVIGDPLMDLNPSKTAAELRSNASTPEMTQKPALEMTPTSAQESTVSTTESHGSLSVAAPITPTPETPLFEAPLPLFLSPEMTVQKPQESTEVLVQKQPSTLSDLVSFLSAAPQT